MKQGFTIIEVLVATFVLTVGAVGAFALTHKVISSSSNTSSQLVASYLAQEGIEVIKNIRDSNLLQIHKGEVGAAWTDGLVIVGCEGAAPNTYEYDVEYRSTGIPPPATETSPLTCYTEENPLKRDVTGGYNYSTGTDSIFTRKVIVEYATAVPDEMKVTSEVSWQEAGQIHSVDVASELYNWFDPS